MYKHSKNSKLESFLGLLSAHGKSKNTLKNYKSDIVHFTKWSAVKGNGDLSDYSHYLSSIYSPGSVKRKLSSVSAFLEYSNATPLHGKDISRFMILSAFSLVVLLLITTFSVQKARLFDSKASAYNDVSLNSSNTNEDIHLSNNYKYLQESKDLTVSLPDDESTSDILTNVGNNQERASGRGLIQKDAHETTVYSPDITKDSLIMLTATSSPEGRGMYIKTQGNGFAIIAVDAPAPTELYFNWMTESMNIE